MEKSYARTGLNAVKNIRIKSYVNMAELQMKERKIKLIEPVVGEEELQAIRSVLESGWLTEGPMTRKFEIKFADFVGSKHAVATSNCTTALELALRVLDIRPGDEVIVPDFTHPATGSVVVWIGAKPVLVDVDLFSYNIDAKEVEKAVTKNTRCIIPVSWGGNPLNMRPLKKLKEEHDLFIVEDAACSIGAEYNGQKTGTMADMTCFSFHPRKVITTGEGGMITTDNDEYAEKVRSLKKFGVKLVDGNSKFVLHGTNYKLSDVLGAIGVKQMDKVEAIINKRIELAKRYTELLEDVDLIRAPRAEENVKHTYQTYAAYVEKEGMRDRMIAELGEKGIETQIGTYALHMQPSFRKTKRIGKLERAEKLDRNLLALPMCHSMTRVDKEYVVSEIKRILKKHR